VIPADVHQPNEAAFSAARNWKCGSKRQPASSRLPSSRATSCQFSPSTDVLMSQDFRYQPELRSSERSALAEPSSHRNRSRSNCSACEEYLLPSCGKLNRNMKQFFNRQPSSKHNHPCYDIPPSVDWGYESPSRTTNT
jgi:hypothetical protein